VQLLPDHSRRKHRYHQPPTENITLEEFETCAIDRLYILTEIESCYARNRPFEELKKITKLQCDKHVPLDHNSAITKDRDSQRKKDITGHFVLRLAFCRSYVCRSKLHSQFDNLPCVGRSYEGDLSKRRQLSSGSVIWMQQIRNGGSSTDLSTLIGLRPVPTLYAGTYTRLKSIS
jgi:hypothetical protein